LASISPTACHTIGTVSAQPDFDLVAASLRADAGDTRAFVEALALRLEAALPDRTRVERRARRLLSRDKLVRSVEVDVGDSRYALTVPERGPLEARRSAAVRGIVLRNDPLPLDEWIDSLARELTGEARASEQGRLALERLLL
jgi:hypothetical protein